VIVNGETDWAYAAQKPAEFLKPAIKARKGNDG